MKYCPTCNRRYDDEMRVCGVDETQLKPAIQGGNDQDPLVGRTIKGRYQIVKKLGEGGMGAVYLAQQESISRKVALKLLHGTYAANKEFIARFRREAHLAASLNHRNIVTIHDFDQETDGSLFIIMEYLAGRSLSDVIRQDGALEIGRTVRLGLQIAEGLGAAHRMGVIHRDVKPDNIMVLGSGPEEEIKLMDFGIARLRNPESTTQLTQAGMIIGTPAYIAPEQVDGGEPSERSDIYALGIVLYEMLSGSVPFTASTPSGVLMKHLHETAEPLEKLRSDLPDSLARVVMQALEKKPENRQQDMRDVVRGLKQIAGLTIEREIPQTIATSSPKSNEPSGPANTAQKKLPVWIGLTGVATVGVLVGIYWFTKSDDKAINTANTVSVGEVVPPPASKEPAKEADPLPPSPAVGPPPKPTPPPIASTKGSVNEVAKEPALPAAPAKLSTATPKSPPTPNMSPSEKPPEPVVRKFTDKLLISAIGSPRDPQAQGAAKMAQAKADALRRAADIAKRTLRNQPYSFVEDKIEAIINAAKVSEAELLDNGKVKVTFEFDFQ